MQKRAWAVAALAIALAGMLAWGSERSAGRKTRQGQRPNILIVTVDTLRADHLSVNGYGRKTSPNIDRLLNGGVHFTDARTVEPLTNPAMCSMLTSRAPSTHGATRNGLRLRPGLSSLTSALSDYGYRTGAFVGNWTLRDKLSGLGEHFEHYEEVLNRRRWFGLVRSEATAEDLTDIASDWIENHVEHDDWRPFLAWVHYVEPHAPYRLQKTHAGILGGMERPKKRDRYDTEIAFVDAEIGRLLERVEQVSPGGRTLILFASDHGESLGEHGYWGHGRNLHEPNLRIPMGLTWEGRVPARQIDSPALITDLAPTVLGLLDMPRPGEFEGFDWTAVIDGATAPEGRVTRYEAHKGAVLAKHASDTARKAGLLQVATLADGRKEILTIKKNSVSAFDLETDPGELRPQAPGVATRVRQWYVAVQEALSREAGLPTQQLDEESVAALKSLGYVD